MTDRSSRANRSSPSCLAWTQRYAKSVHQLPSAAATAYRAGFHVSSPRPGSPRESTSSGWVYHPPSAPLYPGRYTLLYTGSVTTTPSRVIRPYIHPTAAGQSSIRRSPA